MRKLLFIFLTLAFLLPHCHPETIKLKNGKTMEAKIIERGDSYIKVDIVGIPITYYFDEVESIDGEMLEVPSEVPYKSSDNRCLEEARLYATKAGEFLKIDDVTEATKLFQKALRLCSQCYPIDKVSDPEVKRTYLVIYMGLGSCYSLSGQYQQWHDICEEGARNFPEKSWIFYDSLATLYTLQEKYQEAIEVCEKTLESFPDSGTTYNMLGRVYMRLGEYDKAKDNLEKSLGLLKESLSGPLPYDDFAEVYEDIIKETEEALEMLE